MKMRYRVAIVIAIIIAAGVLFKVLIGRSTVALLDSQGPVALQERNLIITMVLIMLVIAVPMLITLFTFAWKYRAGAGNRKAKYEPEQSHGAWNEIIFWVIPAIIVAVLGTLAWKNAHALDPYQPIQSSTPSLTIEVVALQWKWLFIYPAQNIATVNFIEFPENTPVHFELTADAPMSSFWIPQLGSQIYAMAAMETQLNLMANTTGDFTGKDTEINGAGYADMQFIARSASESDFESWVQSVQSSSTYPALNSDEYNALSQPSENNPATYYSSVSGDLFDGVMMKYMAPSSAEATEGEPTSTQAMPASMPGMQM